MEGCRVHCSGLDCELLELEAETSPPLSFNDCRLMDQNIPLPFWGCCWSHAVRQSALSTEEATCAVYLITFLALRHLLFLQSRQEPFSAVAELQLSIS